MDESNIIVVFDIGQALGLLTAQSALYIFEASMKLRLLDSEPKYIEL